MGWGEGGGVNMEYSKVCINSHHVKQMVANAVKISETDVIGQINAWCDNPILDSIRFHKVKKG